LESLHPTSPDVPAEVIAKRLVPPAYTNPNYQLPALVACKTAPTQPRSLPAPPTSALVLFVLSQTRLHSRLPPSSPLRSLRLCSRRPNFNPWAGYLRRIARTTSPRWWGLAAPRTCTGGLLLRRQVGEHAAATGSRRLPRSSFSVDLEGVGSGGVQSLLTAPRRINPGAVASIGPCL
jgi:hypothetical protein